MSKKNKNSDSIAEIKELTNELVAETERELFEYKATVTEPFVNVRESSNRKSKVLKIVTPKDKFIVVEESDGFAKTKDGWIDLAFVRKCRR